MVKQFNFEDINSFNVDGKRQHYFSVSMISTCSPLFDGCEDNHAVERKLIKHKVIGKYDQPDSEMCELVVNFKSKAHARAFITRLNKYLVKKESRIKAAESF